MDGEVHELRQPQPDPVYEAQGTVTTTVADMRARIDRARADFGLPDRSEAFAVDLALALGRGDNGTRSRTWARSYGLAVIDVYDLFIVQGGSCPICCESLGDFFEAAFVVDHCHETNIVRGLLHSRCNNYLGRLGDTREAAYAELSKLIRAITYMP